MSGFDLPPIGLERHTPRAFVPPLVGEQEPRRVGDGLPTVAPEGASTASFEGLLGDALARVQELQDDTRQKVRGLSLGEDVELHDVMIAANKSETAFNLLLEVRNKLVDAWEKLSRSVM